MPDTPPSELIEKLKRHGQQHLLAWWDDLDAAGRAGLISQIEAVDFDEIAALLTGTGESADEENPEDRARRAQRAHDLVRLPRTPAEFALHRTARTHGEKLLSDGKVGIILVAGGQGSRLGFEHPKGMFPAGPVSGNMLFQLLIEQAVARARRAVAAIPYYVMTSDATHEETLACFDENDCFGLNPLDVKFFRQGTMPAVDAVTGRLLLAEKGCLARSPDGHGGKVKALEAANLLEDMRGRGVEYLYYHQIDNPLAVVCDPIFLGFHVEHESEMSTKVVAKSSAGERMGVVVDVDGQTEIIEYSDMPADVAAQTDDDGELLHWAGSTAIHVFNREFLERLTRDELPFHRAFKTVDYVDENGEKQTPAKPNAFKFERFIFDALTRASRALVLEADRSREFSPIKNGEGADSPATSRRDMVALHTRWLREAGAIVPDGADVEISPLFALDADEVREKVPAGTEFTAPVFLHD